MNSDSTKSFAPPMSSLTDSFYHINLGRSLAVGVIGRYKSNYQMIADTVTTLLNGDNQLILTYRQFLVLFQSGPVYPRSPIGSVSFQAETDNRKNFPNDRTFHLFKRQRYGNKLYFS